MKLTCVVAYVKDRYTGALRRGSVYSGETIVKDVPGESTTISFELKTWDGEPMLNFGHLASRPEAITAKNVDAILAVVKGALREDALSKYDAAVVEALLRAKGWAIMSENYDILRDQEGWGYMGGTGCGKLIHKLKFDKILGVKPELSGTRRTLAAMAFNAMLGKVKAIRQETKHLREALAEDQVFVTMNAYPVCQNTVRYYSAMGYPVVNQSAAKCSCTKCAKKTGVTLDKAAHAKAQGTPDSIEFEGYHISVSRTPHYRRTYAIYVTPIEKATAEVPAYMRDGKNLYAGTKAEALYKAKSQVLALKPTK